MPPTTKPACRASITLYRITSHTIPDPRSGKTSLAPRTNLVQLLAMASAEPMQADAPALMRAGQLKENLEGLSRLEPGVAKRIRQRITQKTLETIEEESRVSWLPVELDVELTEAVCAELGERGVFEWARGTLVKSLEGSLLGPMLRSTLKLFGMGPKAVFKLAPRAWKVIFRNCGEIT